MQFKTFRKVLWTCFLLLVCQYTYADVVTTQEVTNRAYIEITDPNLRMNFRNQNNVSGTPMGVLGGGSIIQLPDAMAVYDSQGQLDLQETLRMWEHKTQVDPRFSTLAPKPCNGSLCVPVKVIRSSDGRIDEGTIGFISLHYINENVDKSRYRTLRTIRDVTTNVPSDPSGVAEAEQGGSETTAGGTQEPAEETPPASQEVFNCDNTVYRSRNYTSHSCLRNLSLQQQAELVMRDVKRVNDLVRAAGTRDNFNVDPRVSACMAYRESQFSPNAKGGTPDWGMYQVIDSTARSVLRRERAVTEGFNGIAWEEYKAKMLQSTLAQADLHHNVLYHKAKENGLLSAINSGTTSTATYRTLATRYNGSGSRATRYGNAIANCYDCMKGIATRDGRVTNSSSLQSCLNRAR